MMRARSTTVADRPAVDGLVESYVRNLMISFAPPPDGVRDLVPATIATRPPVRAERLFDLFTRREFCYLSRRGSASYRDHVLPWLLSAIAHDRPLDCFYDIGGGYHASVRPGLSALSFDVGLGELMILRQVARFAQLVTRLHPPGIRFHLVIDNLCALLINDIPLDNTRSYCARLRTLVAETGMSGLVDLLVESEVITRDAFVATPEDDATSAPVVGAKERENIERFLGRRCTDAEALDRARRYRWVIRVSERLLAPHISGPHFTQRATTDTLCFRPFPGADSRIQCGQVVLSRTAGHRLHPILLTSTNEHRFRSREHPLPHLLPPVIGAVVSVSPRHSEQTALDHTPERAHGSRRGAA
ncbi:MAG: hypothetical protein AB7I50_21745 [Vicinamibacterales bacterium]